MAMKRNYKRGQIHHEIAQFMLHGKPVSPDEIKAAFKDTKREKVMYRLSTHIWNIKQDGGVIQVHKTGRKVTGYQLMNPKDFDDKGFHVGCNLNVKDRDPLETQVKEVANV